MHAPVRRQSPRRRDAGAHAGEIDGRERVLLGAVAEQVVGALVGTGRAAHEQLLRDDLPVAQIDDRLREHAQRATQRARVDRIRVRRSVVAQPAAARDPCEPVLAALLAVGERAARQGEQLLDRRHVVRQLRQSEARRQAKPLARRLDLLLADGEAQSFRDATALREARVRQERDELVAADAREHVLGAQAGAHAPRGIAQDDVSDRVPERVVDALEVVEVEQHRQQAAARAARARRFARQRGLERAAIREAGERIVMRLLLELARDALQLAFGLLARGCVALDHRGADDVAVAIAHWREPQRDVEARSVAAQALGVERGDRVTVAHAREGAGVLRAVLGRNEHREVASEHLLRAPAVQRDGARVPHADAAVEVRADDRVARRLDQRGQLGHARQPQRARRESDQREDGAPGDDGGGDLRQRRQPVPRLPEDRRLDEVHGAAREDERAEQQEHALELHVASLAHVQQQHDRDRRVRRPRQQVRRDVDPTVRRRPVAAHPARHEPRGVEQATQEVEHAKLLSAALVARVRRPR